MVSSSMTPLVSMTAALRASLAKRDSASRTHAQGVDTSDAVTSMEHLYVVLRSMQCSLRDESGLARHRLGVAMAMPSRLLGQQQQSAGAPLHPAPILFDVPRGQVQLHEGVLRSLQVDKVLPVRWNQMCPRHPGPCGKCTCQARRFGAAHMDRLLRLRVQLASPD